MGEATYKYCVRVRETQEVIQIVPSFPVGYSMIAQFEEEDKADGCYQPDFYELAMRDGPGYPWKPFAKRAKVLHNDKAFTTKAPSALLEAVKAKAKSEGKSFAATLIRLMEEYVNE